MTGAVRRALRPCPACRGADVDVLHHQRFTLPEGHILGDGYDVVHCRACGFVYADTAAEQVDYDRFYAELSKYESSVASGGGLSPHDQARLVADADWIAETVPDRTARILDFGCAGGGLLKALADRGYSNLHGIDPSPACAERVRTVVGIPADAGSLFAIPDGLGTFQCIVLAHVLEHVEDVRRALDNLRSLLAPGGMLYLEVPDASRYADFITAPFQDFNTEHINHFSALTLDNACGQAGFDRVSAGAEIFESAPKMPYPVIYGFWRRSDRPRPIVRDAELGGRIEEYVRRSRTIMEGYDARIRSLLDRAPKILVWGTGQLALKLLNETALRDAAITAFIDGNPINHGRVLKGLPILSPDAIKGIDEPILVTSTIHYQSISRAIRDRYGNEVEVVGLE